MCTSHKVTRNVLKLVSTIQNKDFRVFKTLKVLSEKNLRQKCITIKVSNSRYHKSYYYWNLYVIIVIIFPNTTDFFSWIVQVRGGGGGGGLFGLTCVVSN